MTVRYSNALRRITKGRPSMASGTATANKPRKSKKRAPGIKSIHFSDDAIKAIKAIESAGMNVNTVVSSAVVKFAGSDAMKQAIAAMSGETSE